jgi:TolA-binding protein
MRFRLTSLWLMVAALALAGCPAKQPVVKKKTVAQVRTVQHPAEMYNQAVGFIQKGKQDQALDLLQQAVKKADKSELGVAVHYNIGVILLGKGDLNGAGQEFAKVLKADLAHRDALVNAGVVLKRQQKYKEAIAHYRAALKKVPRDPL